ncbi:MAG TPA: 2-oxoacid:acceptor oxidoreductase subunit alpha [Thermoanaerobacterales bacterium]|nr:2-oxoacid:acceptor oxidoreductase subunit alpha [Thermoanaerobacterales bacterium]
MKGFKTQNRKVAVIQGNEAVVEGAIAAGCRFFAGYPITPASEIAELMSRRLPQVGGAFLQMEDELASINAVIGASWGGMKCCTASSGPGISLMQEGIGYAAVTETPCVIVNVMRGGPATGQPTMASQQDIFQAKYGSHGDYEIIALCPASAQEAYELTIKAFNLAEIYRVPVFLLSDEIVGHTREKVEFCDYDIIKRKAPQKSGYLPYRSRPDGLLEGMPSFNRGYKLLIDGQLHDEAGNRAGANIEKSAQLIKRLCNKITNHIDDLMDLDVQQVEDAEICIVTFGSASRPAMEAISAAREVGIRAGLIRLRTLFPFPEKEIADLTKDVSTLLVPELNIGKLVLEVRRSVRDKKIVSLPKLGGALHTPDEILEAIKKEVR